MISEWSYLQVVFVHLAYSSAVKVKHADAAAHCDVVTAAVQSREIDEYGAEAFLDFCRDGVQQVIEGAKLPQGQTGWLSCHGYVILLHTENDNSNSPI